MSNHLHLVVQARKGSELSNIIRDFKKYTSKAILKTVQEIPESRREWLLDKFSFEAQRTKRANKYKFWKDSNRAIDLNGGIDIWEKINYIHNNPVRAGIVENPSDYVYSSARDYERGRGLVSVEVLN